MKTGSGRFVVLRHEFPRVSDRQDHFDLMLEEEGELWTWALLSWPEEGGIVQATRLADHRVVYLDYEGEISGNRGNVVQILSGTFQFLSKDESKIWVELKPNSEKDSEQSSIQISIELTPRGQTCAIHFTFPSK